MHFYPLHIGDFAAATKHLTDDEELAYRRALDAYYRDEKPLRGDATGVARLLGMRGKVEAVSAVLDEFFERTDTGWRNRRADAEISNYNSIKRKRSAAGKASAAARKNRC